MENHLQAIVTVLSLINPAVCAAIFTSGESGRTRIERRADATKASLAVFTILVISAVAGTRILHVFGLSLDAFMVAGGVVLGWMGFGMLSGTSAAPPVPLASKGGTPSLTPLVLFAASPGTITGVITVSASHSVYDIPETALVAVVVGALVLWAVLFLTIRLGRTTKGPQQSLFSQTATRFMGLIVLAMGIQYALEGFRSFMQIGGG